MTYEGISLKELNLCGTLDFLNPIEGMGSNRILKIKVLLWN
jgi:hypothetical protein